MSVPNRTAIFLENQNLSPAKGQLIFQINDMETIIFHCKTVTPLVMNGAYGNNDPELRPPGIKASLRFWWRALHGYLPLEDIKDRSGNVITKGLRSKESEIFGSTKGRSKIVVRIKQDTNESPSRKYSLLPHKGGSEALSFSPEDDFQIRLDCPAECMEMIKKLFVLSCTLGGWGKRSRRGFGSVAVTRIDVNGSTVENFNMPETIDEIYELLDKRYFNMASNKISSNFSRDEAYPYLRSIEIGSEETSLTQVGQATHDTMGRSEPGKINYKYSVGAGSPRYASPVVISILPNHYPIVTTLKNVPPQITQNDRNNGAFFDATIQNTLKDKIL